MKSGVSLQQMLTEVKRQSESKEDYLIAPNRLRMESYGKEMFLHLSDDSGTELIEPMTITGIAHRQIGTHLRIPAAYYDRMREERPDLLAYNANTWFKQESSQRMLRTLDGSARAYLSNRYRRIDNIDIAGVTLPILGGLPDIRFESCQITESRMYIKAVNTAPVVKIHENETQEIHFETSTTHYYIKPRPFVLAVLNPRRQTLAACA